MSDTKQRANRRQNSANSGAGNAVYGLGFIGALVYFFGQAETFWEYLLAVLQAIVWPALLVYSAFRGLAG